MSDYCGVSIDDFDAFMRAGEEGFEEADHEG